MLSPHAFLLDEATIRNVANGRTAQAKKTSFSTCHQKCQSHEGNWKGIVWEPNKMYVAKWEDKLTGKIKYVWFSDTAFLKQNREKEKFQKAENLGQTNRRN